MHFVKKVPTTQEEEDLKKKERALKQKVFCSIRDKIFAKTKKNEYDDEILSLTQKLLEKNPDIYSFWIFRRKAIAAFVEKKTELLKSGVESDKIAAHELAEKIEGIFGNELLLTLSCIVANPKSYSAWFHRGWVLQQQKEPNIKLDLEFCEKALKLDCRNFHVWDHRRLVTKLGNIQNDDELQFSNKLIGDNFSNYSAWHYRVTLLPRIKDESAAISGAYRMDEETLEDELKRVTSAFYTDPDDQSAWVYTRWLLDVSSDKEWMCPDSRLPPVPISVTFNGDKTTVVMSRATSEDIVQTFFLSESEGQWIPFSSFSKNPKSAKVWQFTGKSALKILGNGLDVTDHDCSTGPYVNKNKLYSAYGVNGRNNSLAIQGLTKNCKDLIELEPENVWALAMYTHCLIASSPSTEHATIIANLTKLATELDTKRKEMYMALASREVLNDYLRSRDDQGNYILDNILNGKEKRIILRNKAITSLDGVEYLAGFISELEVPGNNIFSVSDILLPNLTFLDLTENQVCRIESPHCLQNLEFLSMASCPLKNVVDVLPALKSMIKLDRFLFAETDLSGRDSCQELVNGLPSCRLIPHWM